MGDIMIMVLFNYGINEFDGDLGDLFNLEDCFDFENGILSICGVVFVKYLMDDFSVIVCLSYYGFYENLNGIEINEVGEFIGVVQIQEFDFEYMFDLEGIYFINEILLVFLGVCNLFDNYFDLGIIGEICCGCIYCLDFIVDW